VTSAVRSERLSDAEDARLHTGALARVQQLAGLVEVSRAVTGTLDYRKVAQAVLEATDTLLPGCVGHLWELLLETDELALIGARGLAVPDPLSPAARLRLGEGLAGAVAITRAPIIAADLHEDNRTGRMDWLAAEGLVSAVVLPLLHAGDLYGALALFTRTRHEFTQDEISLLESFAAQAASAIANARLHANSVRARREAEVLADLTGDISASLDLDTVLQRVADAAKELCEADLARIALYQEEARGLRFRYAAGTAYREYGDMVIRPGQGVGGQVLLTGRPYRTNDYMNDPVISKDFEEAVRVDGLRAVMGVPIAIDGQMRGVIFVDNRNERPFTDRDEAILVRLADHAAIAIRNAQLHEETQRRLRETEGLLNVAQTVGSSLDPVEIARLAARETTLLLGADSSLFFILDDRDEFAIGFAGYHVPEHLRRSDYRLAVGDLPSAVREAMQSGTAVTSAEVPTDPRFEHLAAAGVTAKSLLYAPVMSRGRLRGAIVTYWWNASRHVTDEEVRLAQGVAGQTVLALDNARLYAQAQRALADLKAAQEQLVRGQTLRGLGSLAGGAAHHLNNLLAVVCGRVQLLLRDPEAGPSRRPLEIIDRAARDAADVVRRLQRFTRNEAVDHMQRVDVNEIVAAALEMTRMRWHDEAGGRGIAIEVAFERGDVPPVNGDPSSLREAIMNVVLNAVDALPAGGRITVRSGAEQGVVLVSVTDTGVGMSPDVVRRAREPFFTTKGVKSTGLGLSVVHGVLTRHSGELRIESAEDRGTTVTLELPAAPAPTREEAPPAAEAGAARPQRVLVIDDEAEIRELLAAMLTTQGRAVTLAASGREALARLEAGELFDLVLTDLGMPGMNGYQVAQAVKARWPHLRVGIVTGWGEGAPSDPAAHAAVDFLVAKPFTLEALEQAIAGAEGQ
jgi:GAF domain-containing protein/CheY-like chemotaxis protein/anti-sigma regulatory factor (Ser/Thr protein kinase)